MNFSINEVLCYKNNVNDTGVIVGFDTKGIPLIEADDGNIHRYSKDRWSKFTSITRYAYVVKTVSGIYMDNDLYPTETEARNNALSSHLWDNGGQILLEIIPVTWKGITETNGTD